MKTIQYWFVRLVLSTPALAPFYVKILDLLAPRLRRVALRNLELAGYPEPERQRIANGVFTSIARLIRSFAFFPRLDRANVHEFIRYEGLENFSLAKARGRGVLVATAHLGNWELSAFSHAVMTAPMCVVVRPLDNPKIDALVEQYRGLSGNRVIRKKEAAREILRALKAGDAVGILIDQNVTPAEGVFVEFFGVQACAGAAFAKFAQHSGAAVVPGFALWNEDESRYVLRFYPEVAMTGDVQEDTQRIHSVLERIIRQHPEQWLWIHRRWKTRPPGEASLYGGGAG